MFYHYKFFEKANLQPDLKNDVCVYLIRPLQILYDLEEKIKEMALSKKTKSYNMDIGYEIEDIINNQLPKIIDEYCNFPLEYRNKEIVKSIKGKTGTLKEILLETLTGVFNFVDNLQKRFYQENEVAFLVSNEYFNNFQTSKEAAVLENKFDLKAFQESITNKIFEEKATKEISIDKKEEILNKIEIEPKQNNVVQRVEVEDNKFLKLGLGLIISLVAVICSVNYIKKGMRVGNEAASILEIKETVEGYYAKKKENFKAGNEEIIAKGLIPSNKHPNGYKIENSFGGSLLIDVARNDKTDKKLVFSISDMYISDSNCAKLVGTLSNHFNKITIDDTLVAESNAKFDKNRTENICDNSEIHNIKFIDYE